MSHANAALTSVQRLRIGKLIVDDGRPLTRQSTRRVIVALASLFLPMTTISIASQMDRHLGKRVQKVAKSARCCAAA